jgi:hypothetical protein
VFPSLLKIDEQVDDEEEEDEKVGVRSLLVRGCLIVAKVL